MIVTENWAIDVLFDKQKNVQLKLPVDTAPGCFEAKTFCF